jgi:hypothetical protein
MQLVHMLEEKRPMHPTLELSRRALLVGGAALMMLAAACTPIAPPTGTPAPATAAEATAVPSEEPAPVPTGEATTEEAADVQSTFDVRLTADGVTVPERVPNGIVTFAVANTQAAPVMALVARINEGFTLDDVLADQETGGQRIFEMVGMLGGGLFMPGTPTQATFDLQPGEHVMATFGEGAPQITPFTVAADQTSSATAPTGEIVVDLVDFSYVMPETLPTGPHLWEFTNSGTQPHEMIVMQLEEGMTLPQFVEALQAAQEAEQAAEQSGPPTPPFPEVFFWPPMIPGAHAWIEVNLPAGTYGIACFLPDFAAADMAAAHSHLEMGMVRLLAVTE